MFTRFRLILAWLTAAAMLCTAPRAAGAQTPPGIVVASTTSTEQSGLFGHILPLFTQATGIAVKVVAVGTGQALDLGRRGDADVVFVHDRVAEDRFVADGWGIDRRDVMYNDFVLIGPKSDPAAVAQSKTLPDALRRIAATHALFISRGDKSGTHAAELRAWKQAELDPVAEGRGKWYREIGAGMGQALNTAAALDAYTLSDRGTWLAFKNRSDLRIVLQGDKALFNPYGVMLVNPARHPQVKAAQGRAFIDWLTAPAGQQAIASYKIGGEPVFFPDAKPR
ncbi:MAG: substrate-binding domain-containing protein [Thiomonas sp.]